MRLINVRALCQMVQQGALAAFVAYGIVATAPAANIAWTSTDFNTGNLDLSGTVVQAVNFGATSHTVTVNGNTATFVASSTLSPPNLGFPAQNEGAAGQATFTNVVGNQPLINLLSSHAFNTPEDVQRITLTGLLAGQAYQLQAFMFDGRQTGTPILGSLLYHLSDGDGAGANSPTVSRDSGTIHIGTFTADSSTQDLLVVSDLTGAAFGDPGLSGLVLRALGGATVGATINRDTGQLSIQNNTSGPLDILGYSVTSAAGALNPTTWLSVANNYDRNSAPTPGDGSIDGNDAWTILSAAGSNLDLSEAELQQPAGNGGAIGTGATLNLGNVWIKNPAEDVIVTLTRANGSELAVPVSFTGNGGTAFRSGDLNFDGAINAADWTVYIAGAQQNLSALSRAEAYQMGDLTGDLINNITDLDTFVDLYDAANGAGAFSAMLAAVPEPSGALLAGLGLAAIAGRRRVRRGTSRALVLVAAAAILVTAEPAIAQVTLNPIVTTGYDIDVVYEIGLADGATNGANNEFGSRQFYEDGISTQGANQKQGLPRVIEGYVSQTTGNTINFGFAPFEENNGLKFVNTDTATKTLTLTVPKAYSTLAIAFSGGSLSTTAELGQLDYTINYAGGATQTGFIRAPDWGIVTPAAGTERLIAAGRINGGGTGANPWPLTPEAEAPTANVHRWGIYATEILTTNTSANILSIDFHNPQLYTIATDTLSPLNGGDDIVIFGIAGPGTVEPTTLDLAVNQGSGLLQITNPTSVDIALNSYEITGAGALNLAGWNSLSDQNLNAVDGPDADTTVGNGVGETWDEAGGASNSALMEGFLLGGTTIPAGGALSLGNAYNATADIENLAFRFRRSATGAISTGTVTYIDGPNTLPADFDSDGDVDAADLTVWKSNYGSTTGTSATGDADGDGDVDGSDFLVWQRSVTTPGGVAATQAVPEPGAFGLAAVAFTSILGMLRRRGKTTIAPPHRACTKSVLAAAVACVAVSATAHAGVFVDRDYKFGDDAAELPSATFGNPVGSAPGGTTYDSAGTPGTGTLQDMLPGGAPTYVNVGPTGLNRPGAAANSRGIQFNGITDYVFANRLGAPLSTASSTGGTGNLDYTGLYNRGFQLWVRPDMSGNAKLQDVVLDSNQHGVRISNTGRWIQRYNGADQTAQTAVNFNQWSHVMVVRPVGLAPPSGGSVMYVNGVAVAAAGGSYNAADNLFLTIGADTGDNSADPLGSANHFVGAVDDMQMFVVGRTLNGLDRGTFDFATDNAFAARPLAQGGVSKVAGDVNQDGALTGADVTALIGGWLSEKRVNSVRVGDMTTVLNGDLNFDGITNMADAFKLHQALLPATGAGLDFSLLPVPEPSSLTLAGMLLALGAMRSRRRS
jgi:hypothetical protein